MDAQVGFDFTIALRNAGYDVNEISADALVDLQTLTAGKYDLLVIPNAPVMPLAAIPSIRVFLETGGSIIACGLPAWDAGVTKVNGLWVTRQQRADRARAENIPHLEGLSPGYLFFPVTEARLLSPPPGPFPDRPAMLKIPPNLLALHPRPGRSGFDKDRPWSCRPLLNAFSDGDHRGTIAAMLVPLRKPYLGGAWAVFTPSDPMFYRQPSIISMIGNAAKEIRRGVFLVEGGSAFYTVFDDQSVPLGARVLRTGADDPGRISVRISVTPADGNQPVYSKTWPIDIAHGQTARVSEDWKPAAWPAKGYRITTELFVDNAITDRIDHELHVWRPKPVKHFIESRDGGFFLDGKPWKAHGVNYMPSSGIAQPDGNMFEHWVGAAAYDPVVIDRDLRRIKAMNLNSVSVFVYHQSLAAMNMLDFLRRCEDLGIYVNLSLRPGTPLDFQWPRIREMIEKLRLARNDTVFAYDLAWEPSHYTHQYQKRYIPAWRDWIIKRHRSIESAEKTWGVSAPSENGQFSVPPAKQLLEDGQWRKMVADYRAFLDEMLGAKYAEARRLVKSIDPNHAVSFRMQLSGDPTIRDPNLLPYDMYGLADAVDIWEPEAYGRIGDWERVKPGHFTADYARLCDPKKPVLWAEMGYTVWDDAARGPTRDKLDFAARYYADFYRMMIQSGADGVFYWWYPGGYRHNERSDFGIINPDGTDRPVTKVIRDQAAACLSAPKPGPVDHWITVNRDRDARGLNGIYEAVKKEYWDAIRDGKIPGLKWEKRPGDRG